MHFQGILKQWLLWQHWLQAFGYISPTHLWASWTHHPVSHLESTFLFWPFLNNVMHCGGLPCRPISNILPQTPSAVQGKPLKRWFSVSCVHSKQQRYFLRFTTYMIYFIILTTCDIFPYVDHLWYISLRWPPVIYFLTLTTCDIFPYVDHLWYISSRWPPVIYFLMLTTCDIFPYVDHLWYISLRWPPVIYFLMLITCDIFSYVAHLWYIFLCCPPVIYFIMLAIWYIIYLWYSSLCWTSEILSLCALPVIDLNDSHPRSGRERCQFKWWVPLIWSPVKSEREEDLDQ